MSNPKIIAERAAKKRRHNPNYQPSLAELKAVDAVLIAQAQARMNTAKLPDTLPGGSADTGEAGTLSGRSGQSAPQGKAAGIYPPAKPLLTFSLTEEQRGVLSFAALCEAENLQAGREAHMQEVQEAIQHLWEARSILEGSVA